MSYEKLTIEQQENIAKYREKYFAQATSCDPADRQRAENAARKMGELAGIKIDKIYWVNNPADVISLRASRYSLIDPQRYSMSDSLWDSMSDSLWASEWLCFYSCCVEVLGIEIDDATREKLRLHNEIAASCFAIWIMPGAAILCDRPQSVKIVNGKLINIQWRKK